MLHVRVPDERLADEDLEPYLTHRRELESDKTLFGWGPWLIVQNSESVLIGSAGFKGKPNLDGIVEIGYGVVPAHRGQGYGFEAVEALVNLAFNAGVKSIVAECQPRNFASTRILERLGMRPVGKHDGLLKWELKRTA
jgi:ribosomal-protein-alanine N-acetyltransferase